MRWLSDVYPLTLSLNKPPPVAATTAGDDDLLGYRPLECVQEAGDVVFLPARWSHLTVNIGETIAIGGQASLNAAQR